MLFHASGHDGNPGLTRDRDEQEQELQRLLTKHSCARPLKDDDASVFVRLLRDKEEKLDEISSALSALCQDKLTFGPCFLVSLLENYFPMKFCWGYQFARMDYDVRDNISIQNLIRIICNSYEHRQWSSTKGTARNILTRAATPIEAEVLSRETDIKPFLKFPDVSFARVAFFSMEEANEYVESISLVKPTLMSYVRILSALFLRSKNATETANILIGGHKKLWTFSHETQFVTVFRHVEKMMTEHEGLNETEQTLFKKVLADQFEMFMTKEGIAMKGALTKYRNVPVELTSSKSLTISESTMTSSTGSKTRTEDEIETIEAEKQWNEALDDLAQKLMKEFEHAPDLQNWKSNDIFSESTKISKESGMEIQSFPFRMAVQWVIRTLTLAGLLGDGWLTQNQVKEMMEFYLAHHKIVQRLPSDDTGEPQKDLQMCCQTAVRYLLGFFIFFARDVDFQHEDNRHLLMPPPSPFRFEIILKGLEKIRWVLTSFQLPSDELLTTWKEVERKRLTRSIFTPWRQHIWKEEATIHIEEDRDEIPMETVYKLAGKGLVYFGLLDVLQTEKQRPSAKMEEHDKICISSSYFGECLVEHDGLRGASRGDVVAFILYLPSESSLKTPPPNSIEWTEQQKVKFEFEKSLIDPYVLLKGGYEQHCERYKKTSNYILHARIVKVLQIFKPLPRTRMLAVSNSHGIQMFNACKRYAMVYKKAHILSSDVLRLMMKLLEMERGEESVQLSARVFESMIGSFPEDLLILSGQADVLRSVGRWSEAAEVYEELETRCRSYPTKSKSVCALRLMSRINIAYVATFLRSKTVKEIQSRYESIEKDCHEVRTEIGEFCCNFLQVVCMINRAEVMKEEKSQDALDVYCSRTFSKELQPLGPAHFLAFISKGNCAAAYSTKEMSDEAKKRNHYEQMKKEIEGLYGTSIRFPRLMAMMNVAEANDIEESRRSFPLVFNELEKAPITTSDVFPYLFQLTCTAKAQGHEEESIEFCSKLKGLCDGTLGSKHYLSLTVQAIMDSEMSFVIKEIDEQHVNMTQSSAQGSPPILSSKRWSPDEDEVIRRLHLTLSNTLCRPYNFANFLETENKNIYFADSERNHLTMSSLRGINVSNRQGRINWDEVKGAGIEFAMIQCGIGSDLLSQDDTEFEWNVRGAERVGIRWGTYLYSCALNMHDAESEVSHVRRLLRGKRPTFPVALGMEDNNGYKRIHGMPSNAMLVDICVRFLTELERDGYYVVLYSNLLFLNGPLNSPRLDRFDKWVVDWNRTRCHYEKTFHLWQYTNNGRVAGIQTNVEMILAYLDFSRLAGRAAVEQPQDELIGQMVTVKRSATHFATGQPIAGFVKGNRYKVIQTRNQQPGSFQKAFLLEHLMSWVLERDIEESTDCSIYL